MTPSSAQHHHHHQPVPSSETKIELRDDREANVLTVRVGPINVPPRTDHATVRVPLLAVPFDGWFVAYQPRLVDENGATMPGRVLHHVELLNTARPNFICPQLEELMFAAGAELSDWPALPGVGYPVAKGTPIRIVPMLTNPTDQPISNAYLALRIPYRLSGGMQLKNIYPAWFMVTHCGPTMYDLRLGTNVTTSEFTVPYSGKLLGVGGHIHDYGRELRLESLTRNEQITALKTVLDSEGRFLSIPTIVFPQPRGYRLDSGDTVKVTAVYDNPSGRLLQKAAMGIVIGYFLPDKDEELAILRRDPRIRWRR